MKLEKDVWNKDLKINKEEEKETIKNYLKNNPNLGCLDSSLDVDNIWALNKESKNVKGEGKLEKEIKELNVEKNRLYSDIEKLSSEIKNFKTSDEESQKNLMKIQSNINGIEKINKKIRELENTLREIAEKN